MISSGAAAAGLLMMALATVGVGVFARRFARTTSDLMVAARSVRPLANAGAISGEYLSAASFLGVAGLVMQFGYDVLWYPVGYAAGYLFLLVFISGPLRRFGAYTIPDFAEGRFDSPRFRRLAVCLVILIGLFYMLPQMKAAGITLSAALGTPYAVGVLVVAIVVVAITFLGGMRGVTMVQAVQFAVKLFAISLPIFVLLVRFGPPSQLFADLAGRPDAAVTGTTIHVHPGQYWSLPEVTTVSVDRPTKVLLLGPSPKTRSSTGVPTVPRSATGTPLTIVASATLPAGAVRWETDASIQLPPGAAAPYGEQTPPSSNASWMRPFGPLAGGSGQPLLFTYSLIIGIVCGTMGLPHILVRFYTNPDARSARRTAWLVLVLLSFFYIWPPLIGALGRWKLPGLYAQNLTDSIVLLAPRLLGAGWAAALLTAVVAAGAFAAFASTLSGLLVSLSGAIGHDIYGRWLVPNASPAARGRAFRLGAVLAGVVGAALGLLVFNFDISVLVGWAFAIAASSFFPLLVLGIWWRGLTTAGAAVGSAVGGIAATGGIVTTMLSAVSPELAGYLASHSELAVILSQPAILTVPLAFGIMIYISITWPDPPLDVARKMVQLHVPDRLGLRHDYVPE